MIAPPICPYCNKPAILARGKDVYPRQQKLWDVRVWACLSCDARVGVHKNSEAHEPLGTLANAELRGLRMLAHRALDPLWVNKRMRRTEVYERLADKMKLAVENCHIGMMNEDQCREVVRICREGL